MAGFIGEYEHSIDEKGRVNLPAKLRKSLPPEAMDTFVITRGFENCLDLYPLNVWNKLEEKLQANLNPFKAEDRRFLRSILRWAEEVKLDKQSRIMIPQRHIKFIGIDSSVLLAGEIVKIELWNPEEFKKYCDVSDDIPYEEIAAEVMGGA